MRLLFGLTPDHGGPAQRCYALPAEAALVCDVRGLRQRSEMFPKHGPVRAEELMDQRDQTMNEPSTPPSRWSRGRSRTAMCASPGRQAATTVRPYVFAS